MTDLQNNIETRSMLPVGTLLQGGKYRIDSYLSSGGFGNTYIATNLKFEEQVAIKEFFMRGISQRDGDSVSVSVSNETNVTQFFSQMDKFRKEARRLRRLHNEHIVAVHDLFDENGTAYYEMDLIKGESLSERLRRTGQPLEESEVMTILEQVFDALAVVHAQGLYHLDLKPANIMIDQNGCALLIDFGASKQLSTGEGYSVSTSSALTYTPGYAPLEQIDQNIKCFGPWTDIYALGATLYKLLTNLTPPSPSELISSRSTLNFPTPVSPRLQQLITWMMKPAYEERPQSVAEVKKFLEWKCIDDETELCIKQEILSEQTITNRDSEFLSYSRQDNPNKIIIKKWGYIIFHFLIKLCLLLVLYFATWWVCYTSIYYIHLPQEVSKANEIRFQKECISTESSFLTIGGTRYEHKFGYIKSMPKEIAGEWEYDKYVMNGDNFNGLINKSSYSRYISLSESPNINIIRKKYLDWRAKYEADDYNIYLWAIIAVCGLVFYIRKKCGKKTQLP